MGVVPEKPNARSHQRSAEHRELAGSAQEINVEILARIDAPYDVGVEGERQSRNCSQTSSQSIEAIGDVDGVGGTGHHEGDEEHVEPAKAGRDRDDERVLVEWKRRRSARERRQRVLPDVVAQCEPKGYLASELVALDQSRVFLAREFLLQL